MGTTLNYQLKSSVELTLRFGRYNPNRIIHAVHWVYHAVVCIEGRFENVKQHKLWAQEH